MINYQTVIKGIFLLFHPNLEMMIQSFETFFELIFLTLVGITCPTNPLYLERNKTIFVDENFLVSLFDSLIYQLLMS